MLDFRNKELLFLFYTEVDLGDNKVRSEGVMKGLKNQYVIFRAPYCLREELILK